MGEKVIVSHMDFEDENGNYFLNTIRSTLNEKLVEYKKGNYKKLVFQLHSGKKFCLQPHLDIRGKHLLVSGTQEIAILTHWDMNHFDVGKILSFSTKDIKTNEGIEQLSRFLTSESRVSYYY